MEMQPLANPAMIGRTFGQGTAALAGAGMARQNAYTRTMLALQSGLNQRAHANLADQQTAVSQRVEQGIQSFGDPAVQAQVDQATGKPGSGLMVFHTLLAAKQGDPNAISAVMRTIQQMEQSRDSVNAGIAGNNTVQNANLAGESGKPWAPVRVEGNMPVNQNSGSIGAPTPIGGSIIGKNNAGAGLDVARSLTEGMKQKGTLPARPSAKTATDLPTVLLNAGRAISTVAGGTDPKTGLPIPGHVDPARMSAYLTAAYNLHKQNPNADPLQIAAQAAHAVLNPPAAPAAAAPSPIAPTAAPSLAPGDSTSLLPHILHMIMGGGSTPGAPKPPAKGAVEGGYRFMGGNPADPASWKKA